MWMTLSLATPSSGAARTISDALVSIGLNVDTRPNRWPGAARPVSLEAYGSPTGDVDEVLLPLKEETDFEVLDRTEGQG
jgi:hypothetical protein